MTLLITLGIALGSIFGLEGLRNTAIVYLILYCIEKYFWACDHFFDQLWVFVFSIAALVCWGAIEINKHPDFVVNMFKSQDY
jgi:hypothetical protein